MRGLALLLLLLWLPELGVGFPELSSSHHRPGELGGSPRRPQRQLNASAWRPPRAPEEAEIRAQLREILENPGPENPPGGDPWYDDGASNALAVAASGRSDQSLCRSAF